jgi:hypothetical protein
MDIAKQNPNYLIDIAKQNPKCLDGCCEAKIKIVLWLLQSKIQCNA